MTSTAPFSISAQISAFRLKAFQKLSKVDWAKHSRRAYNLSVFVGVAFYCVFIAAKFAVTAGNRAWALWAKYEVGNKIKAAVEKLKAEFKPTPLSVRVAEVKESYSVFGAWASRRVDAAIADYDAMRGEPK